MNDNPNMLIQRKNPKREAEQFLRALGVAYNDLITGDHAADILVRALHTFTDYQRHMEMIDILDEINRLKVSTVTTPYVMQNWGRWDSVPAENTGENNDDFRRKFLGEWNFPARYSREDIGKMVGRGELSPSRAEEMMRETRGHHLLTDRHGSQDYCGGPGKCKWCDRESK